VAADAAAVAGAGGASDWDPYSDEQGNVYYVNRVTGETSWEKPVEAGTARPGMVYEDDGFSPAEDGSELTALHTADFAGVAPDEGEAPRLSSGAATADLTGSPKTRYRIDL
jgi:hypothetical protein